MLAREVVEELSCRARSAGSHVCEAFADTLNSFGVVLTFPIQVLGEDFIQCLGRVFAAPPGELLKLHHPLC